MENALIILSLLVLIPPSQTPLFLAQNIWEKNAYYALRYPVIYLCDHYYY